MKRMAWWTLAAGLPVFLQAAPLLTGETSNPANSCFAHGSAARAVFKASGFTAGTRPVLCVQVFDEADAYRATLVSNAVAVAADGTWSGDVALPTDRYGFFRVRATLGGVTWPKTGSRPAGCLTYHVAPDPSTRPLYGENDHFLGIHGVPCEAAYYLQWVGARWGLRGIGPFDTTNAYVRAKEQMVQRGWTYYGFYSPQATHLKYDIAWMSPADQAWFKAHWNDAWDLFFTDEGRAIYTRILERQVRLSLQQPFFNRERIWEVLWEPELSVPSPKHLVQAATFARDIIKRIDPDARVALPTISGLKHADYYKQIFSLGVMKQADLFDMHFYSALPPEENGYIQDVRQLVKMVREAAGRPLPMIATEGGYNAVATKEEEWKQMVGIVRMLLILKGEGFRQAMPFYGSDYGGDYADRASGDYGITYNLQLPKVRFGPARVAPRPVFSALSGFAMMVDTAKPTASLDFLGETAMGYAFEDPEGEVTLALWCWGGEPTAVEIPVGADTVRVGDIMGNLETRPVPDGVFRETLSEKPIYVKGVSRALWGKKAAGLVRLARDSFAMVAGGTCRLEGVAEKAVTLDVRPATALGTPPFSKSVPKGPFAVSFRLPDLLPDGVYPVTVAARDGGKIVSLAGARIVVDAPVKIKNVSGGFAGNEPALSVALENLTDVPQQGALAARVKGVPDARLRAHVTVPPRTETRVVLSGAGWRPDPFTRFAYDVSFTAANGHRTVLRKDVNFLAASHVPGVTNATELGAWNPGVWHALPWRIERKPEFTRDADDVSARLAVGWNASFFLMAFDVTDDQFCPPTRGDWWSWRGDAVQVAFAKDVLPKATDNAWADALNQALTENTLALTPAGPMATRTVSYDPVRFPCDVNGSACRVKDAWVTVSKEPAAKGARVVYRVAFPWKYLNKATANAGETVYFAAAINDSDAGQPDLSALSVFELKTLAPRGFGAVFLADEE